MHTVNHYLCLMDRQHWAPRTSIVNQQEQLVMIIQASNPHEEYSNKCYLLSQYLGGKSILYINHCTSPSPCNSHINIIYYLLSTVNLWWLMRIVVVDSKCEFK